MADDGQHEQLPPEIFGIVFRWLDAASVVVFSELNRASYAVAHSTKFRGEPAKLVATTSKAKFVFNAWPTLRFDLTLITSMDTTSALHFGRFWRQLCRLTTSKATQIAVVDLTRVLKPCSTAAQGVIEAAEPLPSVTHIRVIQPRVGGYSLAPRWLPHLTCLEIRVRPTGPLLLEPRFELNEQVCPKLEILKLEGYAVRLGVLPRLVALGLHGAYTEHHIVLLRENFPALRRLQLTQNETMSDLPPDLPPLIKLSLRDVTGVKTLPNVLNDSLTELEIVRAPSLSAMSGICRARVVMVNSCRGILDDVSVFQHAEELYINSREDRLPQGIELLQKLRKLTLLIRGSPADGTTLGKKLVRLKKMNELCLDAPSLTLCANFKKVLARCHTITLRCSFLPELIRPIGLAQVVDLSRCAINDTAALRFVNTLYLADNPGITDVSALGQIRYLDLSRCTNLCDVRALTGVEELYLTDCPLVDDASALGGCRVLSLAGTAVVDVSNLGRVLDLDISRTRVSSIGALIHCPSLKLARCFKITDLTLLCNNQQRLDLAFLPVTDAILHRICNVRCLNISGCQSVTSIDMLKCIRELDVSGCTSITSLASVQSIPRLRTQGCVGMARIERERLRGLYRNALQLRY